MRKKNICLLFLLFILIVQVLLPVKVFASNLGGIDVTMNSGQLTTEGEIQAMTKEEAWTKVFTEYKGVIVGVMGVGTLTMVILFIFNFMQLGKSATNPQDRKKALNALLWTGLATAGLGGVTLFVGFSRNLLK